MEFPEPVIELAIEPKTKLDRTRLGEALAKLAEEDPTFRAHTDQETGQTIIAGMGELHLEIIVDRLLREFKVEANVGKPQVAYRERPGNEVSKASMRSSVWWSWTVWSRNHQHVSSGCLVRATNSSPRCWWCCSEGIHPGS